MQNKRPWFLAPLLVFGVSFSAHAASFSLLGDQKN